jgi:proteasome accessory factor C
MSKKSTPTQKAARMLDLVPYISSHQGVSTTELAAQFGISVAELLSDLNSLWMCGDNRFDLIDLEFASGYVSIRNAETLNRVRNLSQQEIIAIVLGLDLISKDLPEERTDLQDDIQSLRTKLGKGIERVIDATPASDGEVLALIKQSIATGRKLKIEYLASLDGSITSRVVSPIDFYVSDNRDFLVAFCELADAQRTFRIDRIKNAILLELEATSTTSSASPDTRMKATVEIVTEKRRSRESLGKFVAGAGSEVEVSTYSLSWLARTVIASGGAMKVLAPSATRSEVASLATKALAIYR